jgi:putative FmdB family regulatory protein
MDRSRPANVESAVVMRFLVQDTAGFPPQPEASVTRELLEARRHKTLPDWAGIGRIAVQKNDLTMPTYEYTCTKCGKDFETFQSISAKPLTTCREDLCAQKKWGRGKVKRKIGGGAGLIFKGSGFYITDYRSEGYKSAAKKDSAASSGGEKSAPKTEAAKPAKPAPAKS